MASKTQAIKPPEDDTADEIIGILTAISVVSKRLATKLRLLEQDAGTDEGGDVNDSKDDEIR
jgi:hypothetical protein